LWCLGRGAAVAHALGYLVMNPTEIRNIVSSVVAHSHIAQAESLKQWLDHATHEDRSTKAVLWRTYFAHLAAAEKVVDAALRGSSDE